jgi:beta-lactamase superfamily II metal-dependent hydrolase
MATSKIVVNALDVGQGCCTFVEVYESFGLKATILIDLGSSKSTFAARDSINYMYGILSGMSTPRIDLLVVSHKDRDHRNLLMELCEKFTPKALRIGMIRYGGLKSWYSYKKGGKTLNLFTEIAKQCTVSSLEGFPIGESSYDPKKGDWFPFLWVNGDVGISSVMANAPVDTTREKIGNPQSMIVDEPSGERVNAMSVACSVYFDGSAFILPGDAEFPTFVAAVSVLKGLTTNYIDLMSLPHHGSRKTTFGLSSTSGNISSTERKIVETFAEIFKAKTIVASADTSFGHPSLEVIELFAGYTDSTIWYTDPALGYNCHVLTANIDIPAVYSDGKPVPTKGWFTFTQSFISTLNIYSTLYKQFFSCGNILYTWSSSAKKPVMQPFDWSSLSLKQKGDLPYGASWVYTKAKGSNTVLTRMDNRLFASALPKAAELRAAPVVRRRICAPAAGASPPAFSRSFGRRVG